MKRFVFTLLLMCIALLNTSFMRDVNSDNSHTITVQIGNIRNSKGRIQLQIYRDQANFSKETPWKVKHISKDNLKNKMLVYTISGLETGVYGIALLDDEDKDDKMKYSWMLPREGFGFADFYLAGLSRPHFDDFKFKLTGDKTVKAIFRYM